MGDDLTRRGGGIDEGAFKNAARKLDFSAMGQREGSTSICVMMGIPNDYGPRKKKAFRCGQCESMWNFNLAKRVRIRNLILIRLRGQYVVVSTYEAQAICCWNGCRIASRISKQAVCTKHFKYTKQRLRSHYEVQDMFPGFCKACSVRSAGYMYEVVIIIMRKRPFCGHC